MVNSYRYRDIQGHVTVYIYSYGWKTLQHPPSASLLISETRSSPVNYRAQTHPPPFQKKKKKLLLYAEGIIALGGPDISSPGFLNITAFTSSSLAETSGIPCHQVPSLSDCDTKMHIQEKRDTKKLHKDWGIVQLLR